MEQICQALDTPGERGGLEALERLLEAKPELIQSCDRLGDLPLHAACSPRYEDTPKLHTIPVLEIFVDRYPDALSIPNEHGMLPLHLAAWFRREDIIRWLVKRYPAAFEVADESGYRPLSFMLAKMVISNSPWDENAAVLELLLQQSPDSLWALDKRGILPIQYACMAAPQYAVDLLKLYCNITEDDGGLMKVVTQDGRVPLHVALASNTKLESVQRIYTAQPKAIVTADDFGRLPLHSVLLADIDFQNTNVLQKKLQWLLTVHPNAITRQDKDGKTPLHLLLENDSWMSTRHLNEENKSFDINIGNVTDYSLARIHIQREQKFILQSLVQMLLQTIQKIDKAFLSLTLSDNDGNLPLHLVVQHRSEEKTDAPEVLVCILQANPGAVDEVNNDGLTPLEIAILGQKKSASLNTIHTLIREQPYYLLDMM